MPHVSPHTLPCAGWKVDGGRSEGVAKEGRMRGLERPWGHGRTDGSHFCSAKFQQCLRAEKFASEIMTLRSETET